MTFEQFDRRAREIFDSIPPELRRGVAYLQVSRDALPHPTLPDVFTLGECATGEYDLETGLADDVRSGVHLYHGSFRALAERSDDFDWEGELWETITHEVRHHRESAAGEDDLEDTDYAEDENFRRREGEPFDPLFYRLGEPVDDGAWEVDGDLFVEVQLNEREFAATRVIRASAAGSKWSVPRPAEQGDVHFCYVPSDDDADIAIVLVRRRGGWESFRSLFAASRPPRVLHTRPEPEALPQALELERAMTVVIWRDSVAMGDDIDAPHEWIVPMPRSSSLESVVSQVLPASYLAGIAGGRATWILEGDRPLAVLAQQWSDAAWLVDPKLEVSAVARESERPDLYLTYWCQIDPQRVFNCLRAGEPLPDRYGG